MEYFVALMILFQTMAWEKGSSELWERLGRAALWFPALLPPVPRGTQAQAPKCCVFTPKAIQGNCSMLVREVLRVEG